MAQDALRIRSGTRERFVRASGSKAHAFRYGASALSEPCARSKPDVSCNLIGYTISAVRARFFSPAPPGAGYIGLCGNGGIRRGESLNPQSIWVNENVTAVLFAETSCVVIEADGHCT